MRRLLQELKRRNVYKVGVAYLVAAFVVIQLADLAAGAFGLPSWFEPMVWVLCGLGFPLALVLAWAFEMTPEGVRRTRAGGSDDERPAPGARNRVSLAARGLVALGLLTAAAAGGWYLIGAEPEPPIQDRSIAVLPFENLGGEENEQFTEGVHDGLLTRLSNISELQVISRTSVTHFEDSELPLPAIADSLGVRWVVEGAVQQAGGQVQVNAQLIRAEDDAHQWAQTYQRELTPENLFAIQSELTQEIARSLETRLSPGERRRVERQPTQDLEAYQLYVQGRQRFARRSDTCTECLQEADEYFHRALQRDSTFALAWTGLADVGTLVELGSLETATETVLDTLLSEPRDAARRALELDPELAEAHASMGNIHLREMNAPAALMELQRAVALKPSYWEAHQWLADLYWHLGRYQESLDHSRLAVELNPHHAQARHGLFDAYTATGQPGRGLEEARLQQELGLSGLGAEGGEIRALWRLGRLEEARRLAEEHVSTLGIETFWGRWFRTYLTGILVEQGDTAQAQEYLAQLRAADADSRQLPHQLAGAYRSLGRTDQALAALQREDASEWQTRGRSLGGLLEWGQEQPEVRDDPRYQELVREISLTWNLSPDGSLPDSLAVSFGSQSDE